MGKAKFEANHKGFEALLKGPEVRDMVGGRARDIAGRAGAGYRGKTKDMPTRVIGIVETTDARSSADNRRNNTLLRAMGGGRS